VFVREEVGDSKNPRYRRSRKSARRRRYRYSQQAESDQGQAKRCSRHGGDSDKLEIKYSVPERRGVKERWKKEIKRKSTNELRCQDRTRATHHTPHTHKLSHTKGRSVREGQRRRDQQQQRISGQKQPAIRVCSSRGR